MYKQFYGRLYPRWIPTRVLVCVMTFTACWTSYMCRLQMPILVVPMIRTLPGNRSAGACVLQNGADRQVRGISLVDPGAYLEDYVLEKQLASLEDNDGPPAEPRVFSKDVRPHDSPIELFNGLPFDWSPDIRGQLIAGYAYGNVPGNFLGGVMAQRMGPRKAIMWTSVLAAVLSLISPILAQWHWSILFITRVIIGVTGGITFPACHNLVSRWAPPAEKSRFIWALLGGTFGTILTYPMVAAIAENINWECGWYIPSLLMMVWIGVWAVLAYDSPAEHPGISDEERDYIITAQAGSVRTDKPTMKQTPFKRIFTSVPFISLVICHFGNLFLLFFYQSSMMLYMTKALGFQLTKGGAAAGLPWAGRMIFGFFFSWTGDMIKAKEIISLTTLRKTAMIFSHFLPGVFLIAVGYVGCSLVLANVFLFLALGFNGAASIANLSNNQDLAPNFAGLLYGIMNTIGSTSGMIIPIIVEEIAGKYGNPIDRWQIVFWIGAGVCILCMIVFMFGGSANIQPWNEIQADKPEGTAGGAGTAGATKT